MIDALLLFGQQEHIGIGIEYIDVAALQQRMTVQLHATTAADVLNAITHRFGYRWSSDGRMVRITHPGTMVGNRNLLNTRIATFKVSKRPLELADCNLKIAFYFALNPKSSGVLGDCPYGGIKYRIDGFEMKNATIRQFSTLSSLSTATERGWYSSRRGQWTKTSGTDFGKYWLTTGRMVNTVGACKCGVWVCKTVELP
jgi:hypothetical protein